MGFSFLFKAIDFTGATITLLTASGISGAHAGDDEAFTAAVSGTTNTANNSAAVKAVSVNNIQYVTGS